MWQEWVESRYTGPEDELRSVRRSVNALLDSDDSSDDSSDDDFQCEKPRRA
ncbi:hypothetical protein A2U01_0009461 [Trifolium medium]|uniref:Uncharacterized protein n=1 Tax=Trifolium medium TaxID=97028 RepID=A0A392MM45_9FABA|nr:hypothetical protein [Trifolium medium]